MTKEFVWAVVKRFIRAFIAGGLAQVLFLLSSQPEGMTSWAEFSNWMIVLLTGFVTGGLMALEKMARFDKTKT